MNGEHMNFPEVLPTFSSGWASAFWNQQPADRPNPSKRQES